MNEERLQELIEKYINDLPEKTFGMSQRLGMQKYLREQLISDGQRNEKDVREFLKNNAEFIDKIIKEYNLSSPITPNKSKEEELAELIAPLYMSDKVNNEHMLSLEEEYKQAIGHFKQNFKIRQDLTNLNPALTERDIDQIFDTILADPEILDRIIGTYGTEYHKLYTLETAVWKQKQTGNADINLAQKANNLKYDFHTKYFKQIIQPELKKQAKEFTPEQRKPMSSFPQPDQQSMPSLSTQPELSSSEQNLNRYLYNYIHSKWTQQELQNINEMNLKTALHRNPVKYLEKCQGISAEKIDLCIRKALQESKLEDQQKYQHFYENFHRQEKSTGSHGLGAGPSHPPGLTGASSSSTYPPGLTRQQPTYPPGLKPGPSYPPGLGASSSSTPPPGLTRPQSAYPPGLEPSHPQPAYPPGLEPSHPQPAYPPGLGPSQSKPPQINLTREQQAYNSYAYNSIHRYVSSQDRLVNLSVEGKEELERKIFNNFASDKSHLDTHYLFNKALDSAFRESPEKFLEKREEILHREQARNAERGQGQHQSHGRRQQQNQGRKSNDLWDNPPSRDHRDFR